MKVVIFVHYHGEIVRMFNMIIEELNELQSIYNEMNEQYGADPSYCFDVMCLALA